MYSLKPKPEGGAHAPTAPPASSGVPLGFLMGMPILLVLVLGAMAFVSYTQSRARRALEDRVKILERQITQDGDAIKKSQDNETLLAADIGVVTKKAGITDLELQKARTELSEKVERERQALERANREQDQKLAETQSGLSNKQAELAKQIDTKAGKADVDRDVALAKAEAARRAEDVQRNAETKISEVKGDVRNVQGDVNAVKGDVHTVSSTLDATRKDVATNARDLVDVRTNLSQQIAKNASELGDLRKKGERDFFDIDITKDKKIPMKRIADIQIGLQDTDVKNRRYGVIVQVDENRLEKKDQAVNQPIQFLVGRDKLRYELVINSVEKDRIVGYLSIPKDKALSAERPTGPSFR